MTTRIHHFGGFRLDVAARTLVRDGQPIALPPKAFDCIAYLIEHRDRAIGRDELIAAVWGKVDVTDGVLGQTILLARRALDDTGKEQHFIRTVVRFGYHWIAPVRESGPLPVVAVEPDHVPAAAVAPPGDAVPIAAPQAVPGTPRRRGLVAWLAVALAIAVFAGWMLLHGDRSLPLATPVVAAAPDAAVVLPVTVLGDQQPAWIRLGLMDLVAERLRSAGHAVVPSNNTVALAQAYAKAAVDPLQLRALAQAASARSVIDVRAESLEGRWRVSLRTLLGPTPPLSASAEAADVLAAAREAADRLSAALGVHGDDPVDPGGVPSDDPLVHQVEAALLEDKVGLARSLLDAATPAQLAQPAVQFQQGRVDYQNGRLEEATATFRALAARTAETAPVVHAQSLNAIGAIALQRQQPDLAMPDLDQAIAILARTHAIGALGKAYGNRAAAHAMKREYDAERDDLAQARIALATAGDMLGLAVIDSNVGATALNRDRFGEAAPILAHASERFAAFHAYAAELNSRANQALVQLALLDPAAALATATRMGEIEDQVPDPDRRRSADLVRAEVLFANGREKAAQELLARVRKDADDDAAAVARADAIAARAAIADGDAAAAERSATASLAQPPPPQDPRETGSTWLALVRAQLAKGDAGAAQASLARARAWAGNDGSPSASLYLALAEAEQSAHAGAADTGDRFEKVLAQAEKERVPVDLVAVSEAFVAWLMERQDFRRASAVAEGVAGWAARDYSASLLQLRVFHALRDPAAWRTALDRTRTLAGERTIPANLTQAP
jgi:DNA-binding winged helix-turn-helix (wHTH) protein